MFRSFKLLVTLKLGASDGHWQAATSASGGLPLALSAAPVPPGSLPVSASATRARLSASHTEWPGRRPAGPGASLAARGELEHQWAPSRIYGPTVLAWCQGTAHLMPPMGP